MLSHKPSTIALILAATLFATGCALKPRQASRFHSSESSGGCNCYTCRADHNNVSDYEYTENVSMAQPINGEPINEVVHTYPKETDIMLDSPQVLSVDAPISPPSTTLPRQPYQFAPTLQPIAEPVVSNDFGSLNAVTEADNPVNEVDVENSPSDQLLDLNADEPGVEGGAFKPMAVEKKVVKVEPTPATPAPTPTPAPMPTSDPMPTPAKIPKPTLAPIPKPTLAPVPKLTPIPDPAPVAKPTPVSVPATPIEPPKPKNIFKPGESFKPGKSFKPIKPSSSSGSFNLKTQTTPPVIDPFASVDSKLQSTGGKLVLRANPVERNVVFTPSPRNTSRVAVPALQASFKHKTDANWLREVPNLAANTVDQPSEQRAYEATASENIATQVALPIPAPVQVAATQPVTLPVRLRAIPMDDKMIKGQQVDVRFREHTAVQHDIVADTQPVATTPAPVAMIPKPLSSVSFPEADELDLPLATPELDSVHEHTAKATDAHEIATPPWRIK